MNHSSIIFDPRSCTLHRHQDEPIKISTCRSENTNSTSITRKITNFLGSTDNHVVKFIR